MGDHVSYGTVVQMTAKGAEDAHLTLDPEYTFFSSGNVKSHTPFALIQDVNHFDRPPRFETDEIYRCMVAKSGHVLKSLLLRIDAPEDGVVFKDDFGFRCLDYVCLQAGGVMIEKMSGAFLRTRAMLGTPEAKKEGFRQMVGGVSAGGRRTFYVPLPFGLLRSAVSPGIPIASLYSPDLQLSMKLNDPGYAFGGRMDDVRFEVYSDSAFVSVAEMQALLQNEHEVFYIQGREQVELFEGSRTLKIPLDFNGHCRRLMVVVRDEMLDPIESCLESMRFFVSSVEVYPNAPRNLDSTRVAPEYWSTVGPILRTEEKSLKSVYSISFSLYNHMAPVTNRKLEMFPLGGFKPVLEVHSDYADQPFGALDLSRTTNIVEVRVKEGVNFSYVHVMAEMYNLLTFASGTMDVAFVT